MNSADVTVATITWARTEAEEQLLTRSLHRLTDSGMRIAIADRGTSPAFAEALRRLPGVSLCVATEPGLVAQITASLHTAASLGTRFILYTEPDKEDFFARELASFVRQAPDADDVGVVVAARTPAAYATFPPMQRYTEGVINHLVGDMVGIDGDYSYGPFLVHRAVVPELAGIDARLGWGWRHVAFLRAHRQGRRVVQIAGDYPCPPDQRHEGEEERRHRLAQLSQNILGLVG
jgi:hypothetical protein